MVAAFPPHAPIEVKFFAVKRTHVPVGPTKFEVNRCNESPLRDEKPDFWPVNKFNTSSLPLRDKHYIIAPTDLHCAIFPLLCMVIELVVPIKKVSFVFRSNA